MKIIIKEGQVNRFANKAQYSQEPNIEVKEISGRSYQILTYARRLSACECFARGLAWALSCLTVIPLLFCSSRIHRLLTEARSKTEKKIVYVPINRFENLKQIIEAMKTKPHFIQELIDQPPSQENTKKLEAWLKARNTLILWGRVDAFTRNLTFNTIEETVEYAEKFSDWLDANPDITQNKTEFYLASSDLTELPKEIGKFLNLKTLKLSRNRIKQLPKELCELAHLTKLELGENKFTEFPNEVSGLVNLTNLEFDGNQLTILPKEIGKLVNLTTLDLSDNQLTALPKEIEKLASLTTLEISHNKLTALPKEIGKLINLTAIDLKKNLLTELPEEFCKLVKLEGILLNKNKLKKLPDGIGKLIQLEFCFFSDNQLTTLPKEIGNLVKLTDLMISKNLFTEIPEEIKQLVNLQVLGISKKDQELFKGKIESMEKLERLIYEDKSTLWL